MTVEDLLTDDLIDMLSKAAERGVSIKLGGVSADVQERIQEDIPGDDVRIAVGLVGYVSRTPHDDRRTKNARECTGQRDRRVSI